MLLKATQLVMTAIGIAVLVSGCKPGNGLPSDLTAHLAAHGISVRASGFHAPLSSRAGFIFFDHDPALETKIITEFDLKKIKPQDPRFNFYAGRVAAKPTSLWGIAGRPTRLKLKDGAQFEYLCLLTTADGRTYLLAEYAYG